MDTSRAPGEAPPPPRRRSHRQRWTLDGRGLEALLALLAGDREQAGLQYERLRRRLIRFFAAQGDAEAAEMADETLDRLARRVAAGAPILDVRRFAHGIARLVARERYRSDRRHHRLLRTYLACDRARRHERELEGTLECLRRCAARLSAEDRELLLGYYDDTAFDLEQARKALAGRLGLSPNALRLRVHRLRRILEASMRHCLAWRRTRVRP
jgi:hypothetical protein